MPSIAHLQSEYLDHEPTKRYKVLIDPLILENGPNYVYYKQADRISAIREKKRERLLQEFGHVTACAYQALINDKRQRKKSGSRVTKAKKMGRDDQGKFKR